MSKAKWACRFSIRQLIPSGWAYLWTLTTPDVVELPELSRRWRRMIWNGFVPCVRVFERHPRGHGFHVHFVTAERLEVSVMRLKAEAAGFGRIHVRRIPGRNAHYIAKYLVKQSPVPGVRMWACVNFEGVQARDVTINDTNRDEIKMVLGKYAAPTGYNFNARWELAKRRRDELWEEAVREADNPNYKPTFPALYRFWQSIPQNNFKAGWKFNRCEIFAGGPSNG